MKLTEDVAGLLRAWHAEGRPASWHAAPVLADAMEEAGLDSRYQLQRMRAGSMVNNNEEFPLWPEETDVACGFMVAELATDYGWKEAFGYAGEPDAYGSPNLSPARPGDAVDLSPFSRRDVAEVLALSEGENDGANWLCVGRLRDGRWFALDAGCDYTGWD